MAMNTNIYTGLISRNYDVISKANKILVGKSVAELQENGSGTMRKLSETEVRENHQKKRSEQRTLDVDSREIVNNIYSKTGDNITYNVDGVTFSNEEMKSCKEVVKNALSVLPIKGSDLDYEDYAMMGIAQNMVDAYGKENLTKEQAEVLNQSVEAYINELIQAEKDRQNSSGCFIDETDYIGPNGNLNEYYAVRTKMSDEAVASLKSQLTSNLPENTRKTLLANLEHAQSVGSVVQSASNSQLADRIRTLFHNMNLNDNLEIADVYEQYREIMTPVYNAFGVENNFNNNSLTNVLEQDVQRFSLQIANARAVIMNVGSGLNVSV